MWPIAISVLIICGLHYFYRGLKREDSNEKILMFGFAGLWFGLGFTRIFYYFSDYFVRGYYKGLIYYGDYNNVINPIYEILVQLGYISGIIGLTLFFLAFERVLRRTRYFLTSLNIFFIVLMIFLPFDFSRSFSYIISVIDGFIIFIILIWFSKKSNPEFQAVTSLMFLGYFLFMMGFASDARLIRELQFFNPILSPILVIIGAIIAISPTIINSKNFSGTAINWTLFIILSIIIIIICILFSLYISYLIITPNIYLTYLIAGWIVAFLTIPFTIYVITQIIRLLKPQKVLKKDEKEDTKDFFKLFTKPQKLTEEEIMISKEKRICLVCKGKLARTMYICPNCNTFYCKNCSGALTTLENACWVCEVPFDELRPVKLPEKKEEEVTFEEDIHKK